MSFLCADSSHPVHRTSRREYSRASFKFNSASTQRAHSSTQRAQVELRASGSSQQVSRWSQRASSLIFNVNSTISKIHSAFHSTQRASLHQCASQRTSTSLSQLPLPLSEL